MLVVAGRLGPDDGALLLAGLRQSADSLRAEGGAGADGEPPESQRPWDPWGAAQAAALVAMAETVLSGEIHPARGSSRHQVVIHVDAATLAGADTDVGDEGRERPGRCQVEDGPALSAETVRRLACDAGIVFMLDGPDGAPVNVSRRTPTLPPALSRALRARDGGCQFPGCTHRRFVDAHHIRHRAHGGETILANLCQLCRAHHRLIHEGGYRLEVLESGRFAFYRPDSTPVAAPVVAVSPGDDSLRAANSVRGIHPTSDTPVPNWAGERPDYGYIIGGLLSLTG